MNATMYQPLPYNQIPPFQCNELTNDTQSSINKHFIMSIYPVCFSVIKSCTYWDSSTLQALHEHACLFYVCNADRVVKIVIIL